MWVTERTVAADSQGNPNSAERPPTATMRRRSRWKPDPFPSILSFLLTISLTDTRRVSASTQETDTRSNAEQEESAVYAVIWDSMKMRMKTRTAGRMLATIIQTGNCPSEPRGEINQPRFCGLDTENPLGTFSFCQPTGRDLR